MSVDKSDGLGLGTVFGDAPDSLVPEERVCVAEVARRLFGADEPVRVGHYDVRRRIGAGGMGQVFEAFDSRLGRNVALKLLGGDRSPMPTAFDTQLLREARAMARLAHPHIVAVFDAGMTHGRAWIAMELVQGDNLREWLRTPRTWQCIVDTYLEAARGLAAIHAAGLVHCDFKPANVMIDEHGRARVTDFGLARVTAVTVSSSAASEGSDDEHSTSGDPVTLIGGTPAYMAPEQLQLGAPSAAADQYAFCVALHEALWGRARTQVEPAITRPPARLRRIVDRGMRADPRQRFRTMDELVAALTRVRLGSRARWPIATAGALALVVGFGARQEHACESVAQDITRTWWPTARERIERSMRASGSELGTRAWHETDARLGAHVQAWARAWVEHCPAEARPAEGTGLCLEEARARILGTARALEDLDAASFPRVWSVLDELPALESCLDATPTTDAGAPLDPERRAFWLRAREQLESIETLRRLGRWREAAAGLDALDLHPVHDASLELRARIVRGHVSAALGHFDAGERALASGYYDAIERGDDDLAASAALGLLDLHVARRSNPQHIPTWVGEAQAMLQRNGASAGQRVRLAGLIALGSIELGDFDAAAKWSERAIAEARDDADLGFAHDVAANTAVLSGRTLDALEHARKSVAFVLDARGLHHPDLATARLTYAHVLLRMGETALAREHLTKANEVRERALGQFHPEFVVLAVSMGNSYAAEEDFDAARPWYQRALEATEVMRSGPAERVEPLQNLGTIAFLQADAVAAIHWYREAFDACVAARGEEHVHCAWVQVLLARALAQTGSDAAALAALREGVAVLDREGSPLQLRAEALVDLGNATGDRTVFLRALPLLVAGTAQGSITDEQLGEAAQWLVAHPEAPPSASGSHPATRRDAIVSAPDLRVEAAARSETVPPRR